MDSETIYVVCGVFQLPDGGTENRVICAFKSKGEADIEASCVINSDKGFILEKFVEKISLYA